MSYMKQVAEMLGLEWNEKEGRSECFKINGDIYVFEDNEEGRGLNYSSAVFNENGVDSLLYDILDGTLKIEKIPKKPRWQQIKELPDEEFINAVCGLYPGGISSGYVRDWLEQEGEV